MTDAGKPIERLYAWIATEPDGGEGVCGAYLPGMPGVTPLIGADRARIESLRPHARLVAAESGCPVRVEPRGSPGLVEFSCR